MTYFASEKCDILVTEIAVPLFYVLGGLISNLNSAFSYSVRILNYLLFSYFMIGKKLNAMAILKTEKIQFIAGNKNAIWTSSFVDYISFIFTVS